MNIIETLEGNNIYNHRKKWYSFLFIEKILVEKYFDWVSLNINKKTKCLEGKGILNISNKSYKISLQYSPYFGIRYDKIFIDSPNIQYNNSIHLYKDKSLCLYHPIMDNTELGFVPLYKIIPWIIEWVIFYEQWKKYGVWLGKEIKH